jgi:DNA invertase Pin-like site-specific DNA recombinase
MNVRRGEKRLWIEFDCFRTRFHLSEGCAERFRKALCMPSRPMIGISRPTTTETGRAFAALLASGGCQSKTEIAKRFGVSRAWVSKSIKISKKR